MYENRIQRLAGSNERPRRCLRNSAGQLPNDLASDCDAGRNRRKEKECDADWSFSLPSSD